MNSFSNDVDLLKYEPKLFTELYFPSQVLASGTGGALSGTAFTKTGANFIAAGISAGGVIYLKSADGALDGAFEIVSVDSATQLTVSVVRADEDADVVPPPASTDITYRISTFSPQANEAMISLMQYFGIKPDDSEQFIEPDELRQASVFAVLACVYATIADNVDTSELFWQKSLHYQKIFEQMREILRLGVDIDGDGIMEENKQGGSIRLIRE